MGSPFRPTTPEEAALFQGIIDDYAARFHMLVQKHRHLTAEQLMVVKSARVFTANQAKEIGLIDQIGYIQDAFAKARQLAGLSADSMVVTYRRDTYPNDNPYNTMSVTEMDTLNLLGVDASMILPPKAGFYYLWPQGVAK
jgi:protease-4